jgi:hypothetical protein
MSAQASEPETVKVPTGHQRSTLVMSGIAVLIVLTTTLTFCWPNHDRSLVIGPGIATHPVTPPGWERHRFGGLSVAAPPNWTVGPYADCGSQSNTVGESMTDESSAPAGVVVIMDAVNCPAQWGPLVTSVDDIELRCLIAPAVSLGDQRFIQTTGKTVRLELNHGGIYLIGRGQVEEVRPIGTDPGMSQMILRSVTTTGSRCVHA